MQQFLCFSIKSSALVAGLMLLAGCDSMVNGSTAAASVTKQAFTDAVSAWDDVFTYHGKSQAQMPQTRYCYKMMSDIVCYDSVQPTLTAKLYGYQDGNNQSWIQPGGGSVGASGGPAVALQAGVLQPASTVIAVNTPLQAQAVEVPKMGEIQTITLPSK